jgi:hypothetical protein
MSFVLYIVGPAFGGPSDLDGQYVRTFDPNAREGRGTLTGTPDRDQALKFKDAGDAFAYWRQQSKVRPLRPDGRPNRPLTAYHIEIFDERMEPLFGLGESGTG